VDANSSKDYIHGSSSFSHIIFLVFASYQQMKKPALSIGLPQERFLSIYGSTALVDLSRFFGFLIYTQPIGLLGQGISPSQGRYLRTGHKQNKRTQTSMPLVGFEPTTPAFERTKTVHAVDCATTVMDLKRGYSSNFRMNELDP
jgi:hypothetical protein